VISEFSKTKPNSKVVKWISSVNEANLFISVFTIGELHKGIEKLPDSAKKHNLQDWVNNDLKNRFKNKIIELDLKTAVIWGKIHAESELKGQTLPVIDGLIAATGISYELVVVTRNIKDMEISGVALFNPWNATK